MILMLQQLPDPPQFQGTGTALWVQVIGWIIGIVIPLIMSVIAGYFALKSRNAELDKESKIESNLAFQKQYNEGKLQQTEFYATVMKEVSDLRSMNATFQATVFKLESEVRILANKLEFYEENPITHMARDVVKSIANNVFSHPVWLHDISNNKWYISDSYATRFGIQRSNFWTPVNLYAMFPKDVVVEYVKNDLAVIDAGVPITYSERVSDKIMDPKCKSYKLMTIRKIPLQAEGLALIFGELLKESVEESVEEKEVNHVINS